MVWFQRTVVLVTVVFAVAAASALRDTQWRPVAAAGPQDSVTLFIGLQQRNIDVLEKTVMMVSDPRSDAYGKHLTIEEVADIGAPVFRGLCPSMSGSLCVHRRVGQPAADVHCDCCVLQSRPLLTTSRGW